MIFFLQDVTLIKTNAELFNADGSMIVMDASMVVQILIWYVDDPKCVDIMPLYHRITKEYMDNSSDDDRKSIGSGKQFCHPALPPSTPPEPVSRPVPTRDAT